MANELFVTLEASDNEYLSYPCRGWLELFEIGADGSIIIGVFRQLKDASDVSCGVGAPVEVRKIKFSFDYGDTSYRTNR
jgi:hypothetical protein